MTTGNPPPLYAIGPQTLAPDLLDNGQRADVWTIPYTVSDGTKGYIKVPDSEYGAEHVHTLLEAKAREVLATANQPVPLAEA